MSVSSGARSEPSRPLPQVSIQLLVPREKRRFFDNLRVALGPAGRPLLMERKLNRPSSLPLCASTALHAVVLARNSFKDIERAFRVLREFVEGPGYVHVSPRTRELAYRLLPRLFGLCASENRPRAATEPAAAERPFIASKPCASFEFWGRSHWLSKRPS